MFDSRTGMAPLLAIRQDFPIEPGMGPSPQEGQDVVRREVDRGVIEQPRIEAGQRLAAGEDQVGGVLGLIDDPE